VPKVKENILLVESRFIGNSNSIDKLCSQLFVGFFRNNSGIL